MTDPYNMTLITNATGYGSYPLAINEWSGGQLGLWILVSFFVLILLVTRRSGFKNSMMGSSLATAFLSSLLYLFELISLEYFGLAVGVLVFGTVVVATFVDE